MRDELPGFSIRRKAVTIGKSTELLVKFRWGWFPESMRSLSQISG
jgi:hypothetical protein